MSYEQKRDQLAAEIHAFLTKHECKTPGEIMKNINQSRVTKVTPREIKQAMNKLKDENLVRCMFSRPCTATLVTAVTWRAA